MAAPRILLIVGGGIAAYKAIELVRLLRKAGMTVRCVITRAGEQFVTPLTLAALSENKVYTNLFDLKDEVSALEVRVGDVYAAGTIARALEQALGGFPYRARDWTEANRNIFAALKLQTVTSGIVLCLIVVVAAFNILAALASALEMSPAEQRVRMRRLRARVQAQDTRRWAEECLRQLDGAVRLRDRGFPGRDLKSPAVPCG